MIVRQQLSFLADMNGKIISERDGVSAPPHQYVHATPMAQDCETICT
ncbi:MAG: hypothetical protein WBZ36_26445 [Candidatus Nitrosopolaris sp.]